MIIVTLIVALLALTAGVEMLPGHIAHWRAESPAAWDYVAAGARSAGLFIMLGLLFIGYTVRRPFCRLAALCICAWGTTESVLRPVCRLMLPMDRPPQIQPPRGLCSAAGMPWWYDVTPLAAVACTAVTLSLIQAYQHRGVPP